MILSNVSVPLLGMVDTGVVGHLVDPAYLGAVAVGAAIFGVLFTGVNFLRMGTTGIAAQRYGASDDDGLRTALGQALVVALGISLLLLLLQVPIGAAGIALLGPEPDVAGHARDYFDVRIWGAPATLANFVLIGWFIGLQNARIPLLVVIVTNFSNILLDLLFVVGLGMKARGVAAASVLAELAGLATGLWFVRRELARHQGQWLRERLLRIREYGAFFAINAHLFVRTMALVFTLSFVTAQGARLGGLVLAANAILLNLQYLLSFALDGFAHAAEALVGKAVGQRSRHALESAVAITLRWSLYVAVGFALLYATAGRGFVLLLTDLDDVRQTTFEYLPWMIASPLVSVWSFLYDGVFVGATRAREMRDVMLTATLAVFLPAWYLLQPLGNHGLWLAFMLFMAARGIGMHWTYRRRVLTCSGT